MEEILDAALKVADAAEVFWVSSRYTPVSFEANRLKELQTKESQGVGLRIIKDGRIGFSSTNRVEDVDGIVQRALDVAPYGAEAAFHLPSPGPYPEVDIYDPEVEKTSVEEMVRLGQALVDGVRTHAKDVLCDAGVSQSVVSVRVLNSEGLDLSYQKSVFSMGVSGTLIRGTDMLFVGDWESFCRPLSDPTGIIERVNRQLDQARDITEAPTGDLPVIFTPDAVAGVLLSPLLVAFNGKNVVQGSSPLVDRLGELICDEGFSLYDDGTAAYRPGSRPWDDEGVPTRRIPLIERGVARNFVYDLKTAAQAEAQTTGSASRPGGSIPSPSTSVLFIEEGHTSFDEMVADIDTGLVVERLLGAGQTNLLGGDFNANVLLGYKVEHGKIAGRVKNSMITGNVYQVLSNLAAIGSEARWRGGSLRTPALYCKGVSVARSGG
ncbi:MAG: TldD/PmbA family protein [Chloroflexi bacterium]|nr:TldD/PmbA family protein [Chloroflexota bacterium]